MIRIALLLILLLTTNFAAESAWGDKPNKRDPVYRLDIDKYPKFEAEAILKNGRKIRFCCVKALLHFYYKPYHFPEYGVQKQEAIDRMIVHDYLDHRAIDARKAWYVFGSRLSGPHGDDLIPFASKAKAELFTKRYGGSRIMDFKTIEAKGYGLIKYLDMP